jgi:hypothetical protein
MDQLIQEQSVRNRTIFKNCTGSDCGLDSSQIGQAGTVSLEWSRTDIGIKGRQAGTVSLEWSRTDIGIKGRQAGTVSLEWSRTDIEINGHAVTAYLADYQTA